MRLPRPKTTKPAIDQPAEGSFRHAVLARGVADTKELPWVRAMSAEDRRDVMLLLEDFHAGTTPFQTMTALARSILEELQFRGVPGLPKHKRVAEWLVAEQQKITGGPT